MKVLETWNVTKKFGPLSVIRGVSLFVEEGSITSIIGPNGAGKTTFLNLLSGVLYPDSGHIYFYDEDITRKPLYARIKMGIGRSFQAISLFPYLTVLESVILAQNYRDLSIKGLGKLLKPLLEYKDYAKEALSYIEVVGLKGKEGYVVSNLNQADQRKLDLALAVASNPRMLLLDEPTSGLAFEEVPVVIDLIKRLREDVKLTIVLVEHKIDVIKDLAERVVVMHEGRVIADGSFDEISRNEEVQKIYLGEE